ncbi:uncharacterized protein LOC119653118 [Hermetia illucens]|nr:uncharacterized protein LOC119653118 [Hermetia illucens]
MSLKQKILLSTIYLYLTLWQVRYSSAICSGATILQSSNFEPTSVGAKEFEQMHTDLSRSSNDIFSGTDFFSSVKREVPNTAEAKLKFKDHRIEANSFVRCADEPLPNVRQGRQNRTFDTSASHSENLSVGKHSSDSKAMQKFSSLVQNEIDRILQTPVSDFNIPRGLESGRFFFFKGLKKMMWGLFVGLQIVKTVLLALFLPSILGSLGKMVGKGISSVSGFNHPSETVSDLDFRDDSYNLEQDNKFDGYMYPQAESSNNKFVTQMYDSATAYNNNPLSRFGMGDQKLTHVNSGTKGSDTMSINKSNFENFLDIPASSLLLTNYDPFYSPLLSRLDAVFQQLGLQKDNEVCRKKLVCFMYSNPAKYAPYSNLVSAQLSRELNELRKPTIDNPDILRFFQYMKAAKDGQDGLNCDKLYNDCTNLKDTENPVMLTTYHDINKLVQARKFR